MEKMKAAIFDMDGTLLDSMEIWTNLGSVYCKHKGFEEKEGINAAVLSYSYEKIIEKVLRLYPQTTKEEIMADFRTVIGGFYRESAVPKPFVKEFLQSLKDRGVRMCVATVTDREYVRDVLTRHGLWDYFDFVQTVSEFGRPKSDPSFFLTCAERLGAAPSECCIFEDALYAVKTALPLGFHVVAIKDRFAQGDWEEIRKTAHRSIESYEELLNS